uniref:Uncharacterized protein n=2 Tax=Guillardia theta TaxID=55529 RepID=A0A7S4KMB6_GUITH|mmetsp:Transcript_27270/g.89049  ORF Transcript_27270/g.89049 Transcript_27270/m.89049 type:complete len:141 (+) Transcript_27270:355-777(+)
MHGEGTYECQSEDRVLFRIFKGKFEKNFPTSGTLTTKCGTTFEVIYDGKTHVTGCPWLWKSTSEEDTNITKELSETSEEYKMVSDLFYLSLQKMFPHIQKIERVQNTGLRNPFLVQVFVFYFQACFCRLTRFGAERSHQV